MALVSDKFNELVKLYLATPIERNDLKAITIAQWLLESGSGTSKLAMLHNNFAGLKWRFEMASYGGKVSYEAHDGFDYYMSFVTLNQFITGYWRFINRHVYKGWKDCKTPEEFLRFIVKCGYCPNKNYVEKVLKLLPVANKLIGEVVTKKTDFRILLNAGHAGSSGARGKNPQIKEEFFTSLQAEEIKRLLEKTKHFKVDIINQDKWGGLAKAGNQAAGYDLAISLHFNASNQQEHGVLFLGGKPKPESMAFAYKLCETIATHFGYKNMGFYDRAVAITKAFDKTDCPIAFLLESEFIDDETDFDSFSADVLTQSELIAEFIVNHFVRGAK
jgi:N-acetylmuramoyl-L-alanine amidase